jgi:dTMP kinase
MAGSFIVIEGLEGAGKSTAMHVLQASLNMRQINFITTREPGGTIFAEKIRDILKEPQTEVLDPRAELLLFYAARIQLLETVIRKNLAQGVWVLADRFELSSFAYQGYGRSLDIEFMQVLSKFSLQNFKPDLILFLDIEPSIGLERALTRGPQDRIEAEQLDFFTRVSRGYKELIAGMDNVVTIDASLSVAEVAGQIQAALDAYFLAH